MENYYCSVNSTVDTGDVHTSTAGVYKIPQQGLGSVLKRAQSVSGAFNQ